MSCNQHSLEQDFTGCYICSICGRIWKPIQPEEYDQFVKNTMNYDEPSQAYIEQGNENEL
jgi:hypothetical protein